MNTSFIKGFGVLTAIILMVFALSVTDDPDPDVNADMDANTATVIVGEPGNSAAVYQTSYAGDSMRLLGTYEEGNDAPTLYSASDSLVVTVDATKQYQTIYGFGASFTESSAWNLAAIPAAKRQEVISNLFSPTEGSGFSLTRTHINSSDYSNNHYSYVEDLDEDLSSFSVDQDKRGFTGDENDQVAGVVLEDPAYDLIPMILEAQGVEGADFKIIASPWSPPSWMKNGETSEMTNGTLKPEYRDTWAEYFSKYLTAYADEGIDIWAITPQNEPLHAHDARWDSCGWTATEMRDFIKNNLGPRLKADGHLNPADLEEGVKVLAYDHNKSDMVDYLRVIYDDADASQYVWGGGFHWYASSSLAGVDYEHNALDVLYNRYPGKKMIHTESSIDIDKDNPVDQYYKMWHDYAGDFIPFETYAFDIITDLNHWAQGYVEWCMVLSNLGQPNPYDNFNSAPVLINPETDEVIYTPLYYILTHFSKFIRPGAKRIDVALDAAIENTILTAAQNPDGSIAVVIYNNTDAPIDYDVKIGASTFKVQIDGKALQTIYVAAK